MFFFTNNKLQIENSMKKLKLVDQEKFGFE